MLLAWVERIVDTVEQPADGNLSKVARRLHEPQIRAIRKADLVGELLQPTPREFKFS